MAKNTPKEYRNLVMYSVFVRNHSQEGTFEAVRRDLGRIRSLGVDIIWLMPIHPIGEKARYDGEYVKHMSFLFDCKCFFGTVGAVLRHDGVREGAEKPKELAKR